MSSASILLAQAPPVVVDAQQTIGSGFTKPASVAVATNGTVYVADQTRNQVVRLTTNLPGVSTQSPVSTGGIVLAGPSALAVDAQGDLYIGDFPAATRVIECVASNGVLTGTCNVIYLGNLLSQPLSLAVDRQNTVFIGLAGISPGIYYVSSVITAPKLNITGLPTPFTPAALVRDASTNIYFVNSAATSNDVFEASYSPSGSTPARVLSTGLFTTINPSGLALDAAGDIFVLSQVAVNGVTSAQVIDIPGASPTTPYIIPSKGLGTTSGMALDPSGNLDVIEQSNQLVTQLDYSNTVNLGPATVFGSGTVVPFNFAFNSQGTFTGFQTVTMGDTGPGKDVAKASGGACTTGSLSSTVTAYEPYICAQPFQATPQYPGSRVSAIQVTGSSGLYPAILASSPVYEIGNSGAGIIYPLDATTTAKPLLEPQGVAISGFDQTVYVADFAAGYVYATNGPTGTVLYQVPTGTIVLSAPSAVAMNGEGDLYIADYDLAEVVVVPTVTGKAPYVLQTGYLLEHPISLALDYLGNLYVGDAGPDGTSAVKSNPGFVVRVPFNGAPSRIPIPGNVPTLIFPQALATDENTPASLYIGDGGDLADAAQVVKVTASGTASAVSFSPQVEPPNPTGLTVDPAGDLYVLDGTAKTITVVPPEGNSYPVGFVNTSLSSPSAMASTAGGQSFVIANIGSASNSLTFLNGNSSTLAFGTVKVHTTSAPLTVTAYNIGNLSLTLATTYTFTESSPVFNILSGTTCYQDEVIKPSASCTGVLNFTPAAAGTYTGLITVGTTAYNSSLPQLHLSGTGSVTGSVAFREGSGRDAEQPHSFSNSQSGRKSFSENRRLRHPKDEKAR